jgi:hypothetical protein
MRGPYTGTSRMKNKTVCLIVTVAFLGLTGCVRPEKIQAAPEIKAVDVSSDSMELVCGTGFERNEPAFFDSTAYSGFATVTGLPGNRELKIDFLKQNRILMAKAIDSPVTAFFMKCDLKLDIQDDTVDVEITLVPDTAAPGQGVGLKVTVRSDSVFLFDVENGATVRAGSWSRGSFARKWFPFSVRYTGDAVLPFRFLLVQGRAVVTRFSMDNIYLYE